MICFSLIESLPHVIGNDNLPVSNRHPKECSNSKEIFLSCSEQSSLIHYASLDVSHMATFCIIHLSFHHLAHMALHVALMLYYNVLIYIQNGGSWKIKWTHRMFMGGVPCCM